MNSGHIPYSMMTIFNNALLYAWNLLRVDLNCSHQEKKKVTV